MSHKLVIFDCDGVLTDSEVLACDVQARVLTEAGYPITAAEVMRRFVGRSARDMRDAVEAELGRRLPDEYPARCASAMERAFRSGLKAVPGIRELLAALKARGQPICVASSSTIDRLHLTLGLTGLLPLFEPHIFSATMVARGKPAPDLFLLAASRMRRAPENCIVVEDSSAGIEAARAAGMTAFGFAGGSHCGPDHSERLTAAGAQATFATAQQLQKALASGATFT